MQLGKKSKTNNMFEQVRGEMGPEEEVSAPLVSAPPSAPAASKPSARSSLGTDREAVHVVLGEIISAKFSREGTMESFEVKGDLQLRISDPALTQVKLGLVVDDKTGVQYHTHPNREQGNSSYPHCLGKFWFRRYIQCHGGVRVG